jgi:hypothetical protein
MPRGSCNALHLAAKDYKRCAACAASGGGGRSTRGSLPSKGRTAARHAHCPPAGMRQRSRRSSGVGLKARRGPAASRPACVIGELVANWWARTAPLLRLAANGSIGALACAACPVHP